MSHHVACGEEGEADALDAALDSATELAISVEAKGGVPGAQGPRLPWLFKGALVLKAI